VKKIALIFFGEDGQAAKQRAAELRNGLTDAFVRQATAFIGEAEKADRVVIMPDVPRGEAERIAKVYGEKVDGAPAPALICTNDKPSGEYRAQHRGKGRWYVMRGDEIISGPYEKDDVDAAVEREKAIA